MKRASAIKNSFLTTLGILSRVPLPFSYTPDFTFFPLFMPLSGVIFGGILDLITYYPVILLHHSALSAGLLLLAEYLLWNLFHFDGLLDSADALLYRTTKEKRLAILKDKSAGSFALFTGVLYILVKFSLLQEGVQYVAHVPAPAGNNPLLFALLLCFLPAGRMAGALVPAFSPPARTDGLGFLLKRYSKKLLAAGLVLTMGGLWGLFFFLHKTPDLRSLLSVLSLFSGAAAAALAAGIFTALLYRKKVGGFTGDAVGMAVELGEIAYLAVLIELLYRI